MMSRAELLEWVQALPTDAEIGVDDGGLTLTTSDGTNCLEIGGIPDCDHCGLPLDVCVCGTSDEDLLADIADQKISDGGVEGNG